MKPNNTIIKTILLLLILVPNLLLAEYSLDTTSTTNGANSYGVDKLLKLRATIYNGSEIKFEISKADGSKFKTSGDIFLKVGSPETYGWNRNVGRIYKNSYTKYFEHNLDDYSGYPKKFYARFESDNGGWAWVGPITVSKIEDKDTIKPTGGLNSSIKSSYIKGNKITFNIVAYDNKKLKTISLNISKSTSKIPISSVSKTWSASSTSFSRIYTLDTNNLNIGEYNYALWVKDDADNIAEVAKGSFSVIEDIKPTPTNPYTNTKPFT